MGSKNLFGTTPETSILLRNRIRYKQNIESNAAFPRRDWFWKPTTQEARDKVKERNSTRVKYNSKWQFQFRLGQMTQITIDEEGSIFSTFNQFEDENREIPPINIKIK